MNSVRDSITSIPGAVQNFISDTASLASSYISSIHSVSDQGHHNDALSEDQNSISTTPTTTESHHSCNVSDTSSTDAILISDKSLPIPASLVKEHWRLIFTSDASAQDLKEAIEHCKDLVLMSEENSDERRWLVRHLVHLRYSLEEMQEMQEDKKKQVAFVKNVVGHHFVQGPWGVNNILTPSPLEHCDHCTGILFRVIHKYYFCVDCHYLAHAKCVDNVVRICAHVVASEKKYPILDICPEIGLAAQRYKCMDCGTSFHFPEQSGKPRLCDYTGLYFCSSCHWNDCSIIPARIVHNWDFEQCKVSRSALQEIHMFMDKPIIRLEENNPKLFIFLEKLASLKKLRQHLSYMRKYLSECRDAINTRLLDNHIGNRRHLIQSTEIYSLCDIEQAENGKLAAYLHSIFKVFDKHIRNCSMCSAKAYICEICTNMEVVFPFDDGCLMCDKCNSIYHRVCMTRKNMICPKCVRMETRLLQRKQSEEERKQKESEEIYTDDEC